jgi:hypothetical protein
MVTEPAKILENLKKNVPDDILVFLTTTSGIMKNP